MPLHLNLFHEIIAERRAKSRDPLKLSLIGLSVVALGFAGYYAWQLTIMSGIREAYELRKAEFDKLAPQSAAAQKRQSELEEILKTGQILGKRIEERFYWGPVLQQIASVVPPEVQVRKLFGDVQNRRCVLTIEGTASGTNPRQTAEDLRIAIGKGLSKNYDKVNATFRALEDSNDPVTMDGKILPTAVFAISIQLTAKDSAPKP